MSDAGGLSPLKSSRHMEDGESSAESEEYYPSHSVSRPGLTDKTPHSTNGASARKRRSGNASSWKKRQKNRRSTAARSEDEEDDSDDEEDSIPDEDD